jgi:hypothetical protein
VAHLQRIRKALQKLWLGRQLIMRFVIIESSGSDSAHECKSLLWPRPCALAQRMCSRLYGYVIALRGALDCSMAYIPKPFAAKGPATKIHEVLHPLSSG